MLPTLAPLTHHNEYSTQATAAAGAAATPADAREDRTGRGEHRGERTEGARVTAAVNIYREFIHSGANNVATDSDGRGLQRRPDVCL